jgi:hypothetical protein
MNLMEKCTERLNLNVSPATFNRLKKVAYDQGRKTGNLARYILDQWANNRQDGRNNNREKIL